MAAGTGGCFRPKPELLALLAIMKAAHASDQGVVRKQTAGRKILCSCVPEARKPERFPNVTSLNVRKYNACAKSNQRTDLAPSLLPLSRQMHGVIGWTRRANMHRAKLWLMQWEKFLVTSSN